MQDLPIRIYPTPSKGQIQIAGITEKTKLTLYDINGKMITSSILESDQTLAYSVDAGIYYLEATQGTQMNRMKLIIIH